MTHAEHMARYLSHAPRIPDPNQLKRRAEYLAGALRWHEIEAESLERYLTPAQKRAMRREFNDGR